MKDASNAVPLVAQHSWPRGFIRRLIPLLPASYTDSWRYGGVNRRILTAMVTVGVLTSIVKVASTLKEMLVARQFGVGDGLDAFLIAYMLPSFAINVLAGSFSAALIPTYIQAREEDGKDAAQRLFSSVTVCSATLLSVLSVCLAAASSLILPVLASSFHPEKLELTRQLFFILLPLLPLSGLFVTWAAVLNANERFAVAAIAPVITPIVTVVIVFALGNAWGVYSYALAAIIGVMVEGAILANALIRQGVSIIPRWQGFTPQMKQVMKQYLPMIAAGILMSSTVVVDQAMAATLGHGSVSVLSYGNKAVAMTLAIGSLAISTAILPQFSRLVAARDWSGVRHTLKTYVAIVIAATVPITVILLFASKLIVMGLFERGAFTTSNTLEVVGVQNLYLLQTPFYLTGMLFVRLISALKANYILMWGTVISAVLNISLDYFLMKWIGLPGIALSTSIVYITSFAFLAVMCSRALDNSEQQSPSAVAVRAQI